MRLSVRLGVPIQWAHEGPAVPLPRIFMDRRRRTGQGACTLLCQPPRPSLRANRFQGPARLLRRKENSSQGRRRCLLVREVLPPWGKGLRPPPAPRHAKCRNVNLLPFRAPPHEGASSRGARPQGDRSTTEFPCLLGPTHPWPTAVAMEPSSPSAFKVLT